MNTTLIPLGGLFLGAFIQLAAYAAEDTVPRAELEALSPAAYQRVAHPRTELLALSLVTAETLLRLESEKGVPVLDAEIASVLSSPEFAKAYLNTVREVCSSHEAGKSLACMQESASGRMDKLYSN